MVSTIVLTILGGSLLVLLIMYYLSVFLLTLFRIRKSNKFFKEVTKNIQKELDNLNNM